MKTRLKLKPGQRGTKKLHAIYKDTLVCVRYRYDEEAKKRFKTVELIVDTIDWEPPQKPLTPNQVVPVRNSFDEIELREMIKSLGGQWNPDSKLWFTRYGQIEGTKLEKHIAMDALLPGMAG